LTAAVSLRTSPLLHAAVNATANASDTSPIGFIATLLEIVNAFLTASFAIEVPER
jgi:hypothetical protein